MLLEGLRTEKSFKVINQVKNPYFLQSNPFLEAINSSSFFKNNSKENSLWKSRKLSNLNITAKNLLLLAQAVKFFLRVSLGIPASYYEKNIDNLLQGQKRTKARC